MADLVERARSHLGRPETRQLMNELADRLAALEAEASKGERWQPIETAPKDGAHVLLFGVQEPCALVRVEGHLVLSGYWDSLDEAWCSTGSTWHGPFYRPTHWRPLPAPPQDNREG